MRRRPPSHKWTLLILGLRTIQGVAPIVHRLDVSFYGIVILAMSVIAFISMLFLRESKATYFVVASVLILSFLLGLPNTFLYVDFLVQTVTLGQPETIGTVLFTTGMVGVEAYLIWRFTFCNPSRDYYGVSKTSGGDTAFNG